MSKEYIAVVVGLVSFSLNYFKIEIATAELTNVVTLVASAASAVFLLVKRYKRGGVTLVGLRSK